MQPPLKNKSTFELKILKRVQIERLIGIEIKREGNRGRVKKKEKGRVTKGERERYI